MGGHVITKGQFADEFKEETVKQVIKRGYTVTNVAQRLEISVQSLYKWVKVHPLKPPTDLRRNSAVHRRA